MFIDDEVVGYDRFILSPQFPDRLLNFTVVYLLTVALVCTVTHDEVVATCKDHFIGHLGRIRFLLKLCFLFYFSIAFTVYFSVVYCLINSDKNLGAVFMSYKLSTFMRCIESC